MRLPVELNIHIDINIVFKCSLVNPEEEFSDKVSDNLITLTLVKYLFPPPLCCKLNVEQNAFRWWFWT